MAEIKWRRRWKPDLRSCAWQPLPDLGLDTTFLVKVKFTNNSYEFLATDLNEYWYEALDQADLKERSGQLNPSIEAPLTKIVDQIKSSLCKHEGNGTERNLKKEGDGIALSLTSQLAGLPFTWIFKAAKTTNDMGREHLTLPLAAMVGELFRQKQELIRLLEAKDKQIDDYKSQGAKVSRKHFDTVPFDEVAFNNSMVTSKGFEDGVKNFEGKIFRSWTQELYRNVCTKQAWLNGGKDDLNNLSGDEMESGDGPISGPSIESWSNRIPESIAKTSTVSPTKSVSPSKTSPTLSPVKTSPSKPPSTGASPIKDTELLRRQALERKLEQEEVKHMDKAKKKKKLKL